MKKIIHLDTLEGLPGKFLDRLRKHNGLFRDNLFLDGLIGKDDEIRSIVSEVNAYCEKHYIKGYHYTRAERLDISQNGLLSRTGEEIRKTFLERYSDLFGETELERIVYEWERYFVRHQKNRDNRIYFNTTTVALGNGGAARLLDHYGGEQIHMPLDGQEQILKKLSLIGVPLMVTFAVSAAEASGIGQEYPWGMTAVSSYHRLINPEADWHDVDAYVRTSVNVKDILEIRVPDQLPILSLSSNNW